MRQIYYKSYQNTMEFIMDVSKRIISQPNKSQTKSHFICLKDFHKFRIQILLPLLKFHAPHFSFYRPDSMYE